VPNVVTKSNRMPHLDYGTVAEEVSELRERIDTINYLLEEISDLSISVQEELGDLENSITVLEELL